MRSIPKPIEKAKDVFLDCVSTVADPVLKAQYEACDYVIEAAELDFENKFAPCHIYQIPQNPTLVIPIGTKEMKPVYEYRMVNSKMPGNKYYNKFKSSAPYGKCPLCSVRRVDTLDHYLPKSKYPVLAVTPINLIPACAPCNKKKSIEYPTSSEDQTLHPYYDNVEHESWIKASVIYRDPVSFEFYVDCPFDWSQLLKDRCANHFKSFNLNELYSSHANEELIGIKQHLIKLYNQDPDIMNQHLWDAYHSRLGLGVNSWQAVMYRTLADEVWFNNGGVLL